MTKLNKADFMFRDKESETLWKRPGDINGMDFMVRNLENCIVHIFDHTAQIIVDDCKNTHFFIGPVKGSIFFRDCSNCTITVACGQFRCRDLYESTIYLYVASDPIIESSNNLTFAPYNLAYPLLGEHVKSAGFDPNQNKWT